MTLAVLLVATAIVAVAVAATADPGGFGGRQLLLISLDGFRHDYLTKYANESRFLRSLASRGVYVKAMQPEFITKTFPNHWTMVTGLHQESHGIVSNTMFDPELNVTFGMATTDPRWWVGAEPIWTAAKRHGLRTGALAWPGGDVKLPDGGGPDVALPYNNNLTDAQRVATALRWLTVDRVHLCLLYFSEPDYSGHGFGPDSRQVADAIGRLDGLVRTLFAGLSVDKVDVIIASDHGMTELGESRVVNFNGSLDRFVDRYMDTGPLLSMFAKPGMKDQLVQFIGSEIRARNLPLRVFAKEAVPQEYHYTSHRRIPDVLVLANQSYGAVGSRLESLLGQHGYDNKYDEMKVPLIAIGPSFRRGRVIEGFRQVDIYGLMCHLLGIEPQPNNGSLVQLPNMLRSSALL